MLKSSTLEDSAMDAILELLGVNRQRRITIETLEAKLSSTGEELDMANAFLETQGQRLAVLKSELAKALRAGLLIWNW